MQLPLLLFSLAVISPKIFARLWCMPEWHPNSPSAPPPPAEHCLTIASHIPKVLPTGGTADHPFHPPNFPFFPRAYFIHGKCIVRISYSSSPPPPADSQELDEHGLYIRQLRTPETPLSDASVAKIWRTARSSLEDVIVGCLEHGYSGLEWSFVHIPEIVDAWYLVQVTGQFPGGGSIESTVTRERAALMHLPMPPTRFPALAHRYKMNIWEVP